MISSTPSRHVTTTQDQPASVGSDQCAASSSSHNQPPLPQSVVRVLEEASVEFEEDRWIISDTPNSTAHTRPPSLHRLSTDGESALAAALDAALLRRGLKPPQ